MKHLPVLGITLGDVCGIGPEITAKALAAPGLYDSCRPLVVGSADAMRRAIALTGTGFGVRVVDRVEDACFVSGTVDLLQPSPVDISNIPYGVVCAEGGRSAFEAVKTVIALAMNGEIDATVTNPLNKEALNLAGYHYAGHTEIFAEYTNTATYSMMLADGDLRVIHNSTHVSLREACDRVQKQRVYEVIRLADQACRQIGIAAPRIAVAGLNPHAGENGLFGREEIEAILPAIEQARQEGILAEGPLPPDTVFSKALGGLYDIVVVMYHDQGHIPLKTVGFRYDRSRQRWESVSGVNITLGLPIIRTSVDHGTAFDQAGKNTATCESLLNAISYASMLVGGKRDID